MASNSGIEWTHHTGNIWHGCEEVHAGCDNCYARMMAKRYGRNDWGSDVPRRARKGIWKDFRKWQRQAEEQSVVYRIFVGSMMDIFEKAKPVTTWAGKPIEGVTTGDLREHYFKEVVPATPNLLHLMLTKRPSNIRKMVPEAWLKDWPINVMTGTSPVDQETADTLIPQLLRVPGRHFLSCEPLLGSLDLSHWLVEPDYGCGNCGAIISETTGGNIVEEEKWLLETCYNCDFPYGEWAGRIHEVFVGGESGAKSKARPMHPVWARALRDQCVSAGVPFHFKQWGRWAPSWGGGDHLLYKDGRFVEGDHEDPDAWKHQLAEPMWALGKKHTGRLLDGEIWDQFAPPHIDLPYAPFTTTR